MRLAALSKSSLAFLAIGTLALAPRAALADPTVVASIPPIHSLVAGVMAGIGDAHLLVKGGASPHTYALRPSDATLLSRADVVFWMGDELEAFLVKPLAALGGGADVVALSEAPGLRLLATREGGVWEEDEHEHEAEGGHEEHGAHDMHVWLDPTNAEAMVDAIVAALGRRDPANAQAYAANGASLRGRLDGLKGEIEATLAPVAGKPFMVFHDAYQYFEEAFGLKAAGALSVAPQRLPGAKRLGELRERLTSAGVRCVFREPQFAPKLAETLVDGTPARIGVLDPLGAGLKAGPDLYFQLLKSDAEALRTCLEGKPAG
ncbi:zinc ABC transporter substrate-binding protein [Shumkonia mesophila]|uniref:zinc ABC transporter substrate-binding protein n=1 Tax=Shumkonia mesophila TaxID=2838854 RepID=UPI0029343CAC|nr:zinc ABC transporter substrate-binding protein [Shumkonia mesophila]